MDERYTVAGLIRTLSQERGDAPMLTEGGRTVSWAAMLERASVVAQALRHEGVGPEDRVAFLDHNSLAYFEILFGGALTGAVNVAVNWRLAPREMEAIVDDSEAPVLVVHPRFLPALSSMEGGLPKVRRIVVLDTDGGEPGGGAVSGDRGHDPRYIGFEEWTSGREAKDPGVAPAADAISMQLYTSGTTGLPKGVMLSNANLATAVGEAGVTFHIDEATVSLVAMPLFHIGGSGWALCGMSRGGHSVVLREVDPVSLLGLIEHHRVTEAFLVPAVLMMLLATPEIATSDLSSLRNMFYGASPIAEDVLVRCLDTFRCQFTQVYGMTETTGAITALLPEDHDPDGPRHHLLRSAGRPHPGVEVRAVDPDTGRDVEPGDVGELWTRSAYNMAGYWHRPEETAAAIVDSWLRTGDAGYLDEEGYVFLHDRIKDMVITGGENVYPAEVENVLLGHPDVADAAVIGVPDDRWGETVKAVVVTVPGRNVDGQALIAFCRDRLAHYKCPTSVDVVAALPRNPSGKILKRELREPYWVGQERRVR